MGRGREERGDGSGRSINLTQDGGHGVLRIYIQHVEGFIPNCALLQTEYFSVRTGRARR